MSDQIHLSPRDEAAPADLDQPAGNDITGDPDVDQLVSEIAQTRSDMSGTVEELGERLDPANIAEKAGQKVREATIGNVEAKVEDMTNAASNLVSNAGETVQEAGSGVIETIRRNPLPAALAGIGIGWLVLNRQSGQARRSSWQATRAYRPTESPANHSKGGSDNGPSLTERAGDVSGAIGDKAQDVTSAVGDAAATAKQTAGDVASGARQAAGDAVSTIGQTAGQAASTVGNTASTAIDRAQRALEANPLAFGAIAVAIGAAVGMAMPATETEKRVVGQAGGQLIDKVETAVSQPLQELEAASSR